MLLRPGLLEPPDGRGRQPAGVLAEQCDQGFLKVAGRQALEVEDRDQHFEAFRAARVRRQNRRRKADALRTFTGTVTYTRAAHGDRTDAGHDLALGQMPVAHQPLATVIGQLVGMAGEQDCDFGLHRLRQQRSRAVAQNLGQRVRKSSWLAELENVSVGHGVSLLRWRSGGVKHPHDTPPYPFMPSPTFAYSSCWAWVVVFNARKHTPNVAMKRMCCFMTVSSRFGCTVRGGNGSAGDCRTSHRADNGNATTLCLDAGRRRLGRFRLWRFRGRREIDKGGPKSRCRDDEPASEPAQNLLIALVTQEPPQPTWASLALGTTINCTTLICLPFKTADQSVHVILK